MERVDIFNELKRILLEDNPDIKNPENITEETSLKGDLGFDSISLIMMAVNIESSFGISIEDMDSTSTETVKSVIDFIINKLNK